MDTKIKTSRDTQIQRLKQSEIFGYKDLNNQWYSDTKIETCGYSDTKIKTSRDTLIQRF